MHEHPIEPADTEKPPLWEAVRVWLEDGTRSHAVWTGTLWWGSGFEVKPLRWQRMVRNAMLT